MGTNEVGLQWFVTQVLPRVIEAAPTTRLAVLARGAAERHWLVEHPHIDLMPQHTDPAALFASSRVSIAPLLDGGGVRVKILESLAAGCPVVATPIGGEGLALTGLTHSADPASFAAACLRRLQGNALEARSSAQRSVMEKHEAQVVARQLVGFWTNSRRSIRDQTARLV